ncbi:hypothetical protein [Frankia sp. AvcI1]|uniref:hypothetical protein n=1 Tax=Frankia sp. AvcI1 TaxID=573496 RepID=UPI0006EC0E5D|nr:hypothetical protein [Frankia sp. AvcI1]
MTGTAGSITFVAGAALEPDDRLWDPTTRTWRTIRRITPRTPVSRSTTRLIGACRIAVFEDGTPVVVLATAARTWPIAVTGPDDIVRGGQKPAPPVDLPPGWTVAW